MQAAAELNTQQWSLLANNLLRVYFDEVFVPVSMHAQRFQNRWKASGFFSRLGPYAARLPKRTRSALL